MYIMGRGVRLAMTGTTADDEITLPVGGTAPASKADFIRIDVLELAGVVRSPRLAHRRGRSGPNTRPQVRCSQDSASGSVNP